MYDVERGDPYMSEYWDIVKDDKDSFNFGSIDQGLKDALTHKHVIWTDEVKEEQEKYIYDSFVLQIIVVLVHSTYLKS